MIMAKSANEALLDERYSQLQTLLKTESRPGRRKRIEAMMRRIDKAKDKGMTPATIAALLMAVWQLIQLLFPKPKS